MDGITFEGKTENFKKFIDSFIIRCQETAEDYDICALMSLDKKELSEAEAFLINRLEAGDYRAPRALGYIGCKGAEPALRKALTREKEGKTLVEIACALHKLTGDVSVVGNIIGVLKNGQDIFARNSAACVLGDYTTPDTEEALLQALGDTSELVRTNSLRSYLRLTGLTEWMTAPRRGIDLLSFRISSGFTSIRNTAIARLKEIVVAKREGKSATQIGITITDSGFNDGLSDHARKFIKSYLPGSVVNPLWKEDYDLDSLDKIEGEEREWVETAILSRLEENDFRAVRALVHIKSKNAAEPFRELIKKAEGRMQLELTRGLQALGGDIDDIYKKSE